MLLAQQNDWVAKDVRNFIPCLLAMVVPVVAVKSMVQLAMMATRVMLGILKKHALAIMIVAPVVFADRILTKPMVLWTDVKLNLMHVLVRNQLKRHGLLDVVNVLPMIFLKLAFIL